MRPIFLLLDNPDVDGRRILHVLQRASIHLENTEVLYNTRRECALVRILSSDQVSYQTAYVIAHECEFPFIDPNKLAPEQQRAFTKIIADSYQLLAQRNNLRESLTEALEKLQTTPDSDWESSKRNHPESGPVTIIDPNGCLTMAGKSAPWEKEIQFRFLKNGQWEPARLLRLDAQYLTFVANRLVNGNVSMWITCGNESFFIRGTTQTAPPREWTEEIQSQDIVVSLSQAPEQKRKLSMFFRHIKRSKLVLSSPPRRGSARLGVELPVKLTDPACSVFAQTRDISWSGMFVQTTASLPDTVTFMLHTTHEEFASGTARVVREEVDALGLRVGFGLVFETIQGRPLVQSLLHSVARRSTKQILLAAAPSKLDAWSKKLCAAGYSVICGSKPEQLLSITTDAQPPHLALVDETFLSAGTEWIPQLLDSHNIPWLDAEKVNSHKIASQLDSLFHISA